MCVLTYIYWTAPLFSLITYANTGKDCIYAYLLFVADFDVRLSHISMLIIVHNEKRRNI